MLSLLPLLTLLALLPEPPLPQLVEELVEAVAQALLVLAQIAHLAVALLGLTPLAITPHVLTLPESLVAQLLLLADHVAQFVQRRHHIVVAVLAARGARPRHLQVLQHGLQFLEQPARCILVAGARQIFQPVKHTLEILLAQRATVTIERP